MYVLAEGPQAGDDPLGTRLSIHRDVTTRRQTQGTFIVSDKYALSLGLSLSHLSFFECMNDCLIP